MSGFTDSTLRSNKGDGDILEVRRQVISGDWSPINRGEYTLTDLGLRHNGNGLVWLRSGVSVHEADHDEGFSGKVRVSFDYHEGVCPARPEDGAGFSRGVHSHKVDSYCLHILTSSPSWVEYWHRNDGKALTTFAAQVLTNERQEAFDGWVIYRHPQQMDKYTVIHEERDKYLIQEYVKRGWKCESTYELSLLVKNDAEFGRLMARLGYVKVRTRKITGKKESFWLYRSAEKGLGAADKQPKVDASYAAVVRRVSRGKQEVCPQDPALRKASAVTVQASETERFAFKRVAVDGCYLWVYADHIRFLKKIRTRVNGKQVQGYSAKGVNIAVDGRVEVCPQKALNNKDKMLSVQAAETRYTSDVLASMSPQDILTAAKNTLIQINATHSYGMTAHNIMLSHGGRNLVSVPVENMAGCLTDLDKLLVIARTGEVLP
ncbi:hypothetical protein FTI00_004263 [Salmonella enterica subsp. enterica serovar London]|uniref:hypothetical protein n=1 Tax=Salmonella enterica TaxID=28901 RepID=UPI0029332835|nr:hypothetical protein [Salmonella enterica]EHW1126888.1 hypothetical protein [Salmonella enterica subsp. enterica serovar Kinondoni]EIR0426677.1 hypothetical protein [Salmonella enterica subsp. enterica serovar London]MDV2051341.1 hypothetical protein [Salmonella enterica subsp. enterica serovar Uzaramo]MDV2070621.1 hypothetical protein [Salmonella enterica subsp. enterica serovar Uzaramo]